MGVALQDRWSEGDSMKVIRRDLGEPEADDDGQRRLGWQYLFEVDEAWHQLGLWMRTCYGGGLDGYRSKKERITTAWQSLRPARHAPAARPSLPVATLGGVVGSAARLSDYRQLAHLVAGAGGVAPRPLQRPAQGPPRLVGCG